MKTKLYILLAFVFCSLTALAQEHTVTGQVLDESGEPMPMISVSVKGTHKAVSTAEDGTYSIQAEPNSILVFSFVNSISFFSLNRAMTISSALTSITNSLLTTFIYLRYRITLSFNQINLKTCAFRFISLLTNAKNFTSSYDDSFSVFFSVCG